MSTRLRALRKSGGFSLIEVLVSLTILGIAIVTLVQLLSASLRSTKQSAEYTVGLIYARSLMDEAYAMPSLDDIEDTFDLDDGYTATREVAEVEVERKEGEETAESTFKYYEITVTVKWPPNGSTVLKGKRVIYGEAG